MAKEFVKGFVHQNDVAVITLDHPKGMRKHNDLTSQYNAGGYIPQQDGVGDAAHGVFEIEALAEDPFVCCDDIGLLSTLS
ncbi:hypothetical protein JHK86_052598 [Glycine max]|nr:hypothetical protein JHK86_052598 [Glycine max]